MKNAVVEKRDKYVYTKFSDKLEDGVIVEAGNQARALLEEDPSLGLIIDDSDLRYEDLTASNKMESLDGLKLVNRCRRLGVIIAEEDSKLVYYANFATNFAHIKKVKVFSSSEDAIAWVLQTTD